MSGPGRLHDLFVTHEAMSPGDYKTRGDGLTIRYGYHISPFGVALIMVTDRGLAGLSFNDPGDEREAFADMSGRWPNATYVEDMAATQPYAARIFDPVRWRSDQPLRVVLIGTDFQVRVWQALLRIPMGRACSYSSIAAGIGAPAASPCGGRRYRRQPYLLRGAVPSRARQVWRADRLPLGPDPQARDPRLGGRADFRLTTRLTAPSPLPDKGAGKHRRQRLAFRRKTGRPFLITVVGSINLDLIATVDRLPDAGETVRSGGFTTAPGGKGANQALAAARAGGKVRMIGAVGKDAFATEALACLKEGKVQLSGVREAAAVTGNALIFVDAKGENVIVVVPGANDTVLSGDLAKAHFAKGEVVLLQHEIPLATVEAALAAAAAAGAVSVLNTAPFRAEAAKLLPLADYVVSNETEFDLYTEALKLSGRDRPARMRAFVERTGRTIIVTLGSQGVVAASPQGEFAAPALKITPVDTVGAGDTFCGYLGAGLDAGLPLEQALRRAAAAGSLACLKPGAQPAIPHAKEVDDALAKS